MSQWTFQLLGLFGVHFSSFLRDTFPVTKTPCVWYVAPESVQTTSAAHKNVRSLHINQSQDCWSVRRFFYVPVFSFFFFLGYGQKRQHKILIPSFSLSSLSLSQMRVGSLFCPSPQQWHIVRSFLIAIVLDPSQSSQEECVCVCLSASPLTFLHAEVTTDHPELI